MEKISMQKALEIFKKTISPIVVSEVVKRSEESFITGPLDVKIMDLSIDYFNFQCKFEFPVDARTSIKKEVNGTYSEGKIDLYGIPEIFGNVK